MAKYLLYQVEPGKFDGMVHRERDVILMDQAVGR